MEELPCKPGPDRLGFGSLLRSGDCFQRTMLRDPCQVSFDGEPGAVWIDIAPRHSPAAARAANVVSAYSERCEGRTGSGIRAQEYLFGRRGGREDVGTDDRGLPGNPRRRAIRSPRRGRRGGPRPSRSSQGRPELLLEDPQGAPWDRSGSVGEPREVPANDGAPASGRRPSRSSGNRRRGERGLTAAK
jgi:hypothetical protein